jgi:hypothetical protein
MEIGLPGACEHWRSADSPRSLSVAPLREHFARADRSDGGAGDDGADAGHADQSLTAGDLTRQSVDLCRHCVCPLIEPVPVNCQVFDYVNDGSSAKVLRSTIYAVDGGEM